MVYTNPSKRSCFSELQQLPTELYLSIISHLLDSLTVSTSLRSFLLADSKARTIFTSYSRRELNQKCTDLATNLFKDYFENDEKQFRHPNDTVQDIEKPREHFVIGLRKIQQLEGWNELCIEFFRKGVEDWRWMELRERSRDPEKKFDIMKEQGWIIV